MNTSTLPQHHHRLHQSSLHEETDSPARMTALQAVAALANSTLANNSNGNITTTAGHHPHDGLQRMEQQPQSLSSSLSSSAPLLPSQLLLHRRLYWQGQVQIHYSDLMSLLDDLHQDVMTTSSSPHKVLLIKAIRFVSQAMFQASQSALDPRPPPPPAAAAAVVTEEEPPVAPSTAATFAPQEHGPKYSVAKVVGKRPRSEHMSVQPAQPSPQVVDPPVIQFMTGVHHPSFVTSADTTTATSTTSPPLDEDEEEARILLFQHPPADSAGYYTPKELVVLFSKVLQRPRLRGALKASLLQRGLVPAFVTGDDLTRVWCEYQADPSQAPSSWIAPTIVTMEEDGGVGARGGRGGRGGGDASNDTTTTEEEDEGGPVEDESEDGAHALLSLHKSLFLQPPPPPPPPPVTAAKMQKEPPKERKPPRSKKEVQSSFTSNEDNTTQVEEKTKNNTTTAHPSSGGGGGFVVDDGRLYFSKEEVIGNPSFFWIGRGGYAITHPGNNWVRSIIASKTAEYLQLKRSQRGSIGRSLLKNEFSHVKFVISRDVVLRSLEADDDSSSSAAGKTTRTRRIGASRRKSLLKKHCSVEQIRSYPPDTCIEVGFAWSLDILNHQLREDVTATMAAATATGSDAIATSTPPTTIKSSAMAEEEEEEEQEEDEEEETDMEENKISTSPSSPLLKPQPSASKPPVAAEACDLSKIPVSEEYSSSSSQKPVSRSSAEHEAQRVVEAHPPASGQHYTPQEMVDLFRGEGRKQVRAALKTYLIDKDWVPLRSTSSVGYILRQYHHSETTAPQVWQTHMFDPPQGDGTDDDDYYHWQQQQSSRIAERAVPSPPAEDEMSSDETEEEPQPKRMKSNNGIMKQSPSSSGKTHCTAVLSIITENSNKPVAATAAASKSMPPKKKKRQSRDNGGKPVLATLPPPEAETTAVRNATNQNTVRIKFTGSVSDRRLLPKENE